MAIENNGTNMCSEEMQTREGRNKWKVKDMRSGRKKG